MPVCRSGRPPSDWGFHGTAGMRSWGRPAGRFVLLRLLLFWRDGRQRALVPVVGPAWGFILRILRSSPWPAVLFHFILRSLLCLVGCGGSGRPLRRMILVVRPTPTCGFAVLRRLRRVICIVIPVIGSAKEPDSPVTVHPLVAGGDVGSAQAGTAACSDLPKVIFAPA